MLRIILATVLAASAARPAAAAAAAARRPHLVHIVIDDLGFHDVGYKDPEVLSPHLDALRADGVHLTNFYSAKWCAPARAAMLTGRYPWRTGYYSTPSSEAVPLSVTMLPEALQKSGYKTHAIGKWHLGFQLKEYTPTFRGFDTFLGYYNSMEDYWTHYGPAPKGVWPCSGVDLSNSTWHPRKGWLGVMFGGQAYAELTLGSLAPPLPFR